MTRIRVRSSGDKIRIKLSEAAQAPAKTGPGQPIRKDLPKDIPEYKEKLFLSTRIIDLMEIRAESSFRPNQEDVELVYALSGTSPNMPDQLHKLSSSTVVEEASEEHIITSTEAMLEHINKERDGYPALVIQLHTHPQSTPSPSESDKRFFQNTKDTIHNRLPSAKVLFGVHAISSESVRERIKPKTVSKNIVKWSSITREHEVGFFTSDASTYEVEIIE